MKTVLMISSEDVAALTILARLRENFGFKESSSTNQLTWGEVKLLVVNEPILYADKAVAVVEADRIIVASRHVSESGRRCILIHSTGNWGDKTDHGGLPSILSTTSAQLVYEAVHTCIAAVENNGLKDVEVGIEATHHGPYSEKPLIFVEVGSSPEAWQDEKMADAVAEACVNLCRRPASQPLVAAVGFGGGHYARDILKPVLRGEVAVGHIASKYHFPLSEKMVFQAIEKTVEKPSKALVDWDGLKAGDRNTLVEILKRMGVEVVKV